MIENNTVFWSFWIIFQVAFIALVHAENETPDCLGKDTKIFKNPAEISLLHQGDILVFDDIDIVEITTRVNNDFGKLYIDAKYNSFTQKLTVFTTEDFSSYADDQVLKEIFLIVTYKCPSKTKKWFFYQGFDESNNFDPKFSQDRYEFTVPLPLYKGFDLTTFQKIIATDKDLSGNAITFSSIRSNEFSINVGTSTLIEGYKTYVATMEAAQGFTRIPADRIEFVITATDSGKPPRQAEAVVVITPNPDIVYAPTFEKTLYEGALDEDLKLKRIDFPTLDRFEESFQIRKFGEDEGLFTTSFMQNLVVLKLAKVLGDSDVLNKAFLKFSLEVSDSGLEEAARTEVIVSVPRTSNENHFEKKLYKGLVDNDGELKLEDIVFKSNGDFTARFTIENSDPSQFNIESNQNVIKLSLKSEVDEELLKGKRFLSVTVVARNKGKVVDTTEVVVDVPSNENFFEKKLYKGYVDHVGQIQLEDITFISNGDLQATFSLENSDMEFFDIESEKNVIKVTLKPAIGDDELKDKSSLSVTVVARNKEKVIDTAEVVVDVPKNAFYFEKAIYEGSISSNSQLNLDKITFNSHSYSDEITFSLKGHESKSFRISQDKNVLEITLSDGISVSEWKGQPELAFFVQAFLSSEEQAVATVTLALPKAEVRPRFTKSLYQGELSVQNELNMEDIELDKETINEHTTCEMETDSDIFNLKREGNIIQVELKNPLNSEDWQKQTFFFLAYICRNDYEEGRTAIIVTLENLGRPSVFQAVLAQGTVSAEHVLELDDIVLADDWLVHDFEFELKGAESEYFEIVSQSESNSLGIRLRQNLPQAIFDLNNFLTFVLGAENKLRDVTGSIAVVLQLPYADNLDNLQFTKRFYKAQLDENFEFSIEEIRILSTPSKIFLEGRDASLFDVQLLASNFVKLSLRKDVTEADIEDKAYLECLIVAVSEDGRRSAAAVVVGVPKICEMPTTPFCATREPCATQQPESDVPEFSKKLFKFRVQPNFIGNFGFVSAVVVGSNAGVLYTVTSDNAHINSGLSIQPTTGELHITTLIPPGLYPFTITAENAETHSHGYAQGLLEVDSLLQCGSHTQVANALIIKHLNEEFAHGDILNTELNDCEFVVQEMDPNKEEYFKIDPTTKFLTSIEIDREDEIFSQMEVPQVQVKLKLNCLESQQRQKRSLGNRSSVLTDDIPFTQDTTMLSVILVDVNDNAPKFIFPPRNNFVIGYPESAVTVDLLPEYLCKVEATDKDAGLNAVISYRMDENPYFNIDAKSGMIYPLGNNLNIPDVIRLKIYATDRDGAADGLTTAIFIKVKKLLPRHLAMLTFSLEHLENVLDLDERIRQQTGVDFVVMKQAIVPYYNGSESERAYTLGARISKAMSFSNVILKVWSYALNSDDEPMDISEIEGKLTEIEEELNFVAESYESARHIEAIIREVENSPVGYIVSVSLLSVLVAALLGFLCWWFYLRHLNYRRVATPASSATVTPPYMVKSVSEMDYKPYSIDSPTHNYGYKHTTSPNFQAGQESVRISGMTTNETSDDHQKAMRASNKEEITDMDDCDSLNSVAEEFQAVPKPRATVTFNEMVERIHIETDVERTKV